MKLIMSESCQVKLDTVVQFVKVDTAPVFTCPKLQEAYDAAYAGDDTSLKAGAFKTLRLRANDMFVNVILIAFDCSSKKAFDDFKKATFKLGTKLNELKATNVVIDKLTDLVFASKEEILLQFASNLPLCDYAFDKYLIKKAGYTDKTVTIIGDESLQPALDEGKTIADGVIIARDLVNEPAEVLTSPEYADRVVTLGKEYGFETEIFSKDKIEEFGMGAFLAVARASIHEPKLIVMRYNGGGDEIAKGLIGKGVCYDTGGLGIKNTAGMATMKGDMAGSAAVVGAMCAIAKNKLEKNVVAVIAACENVIAGNAYRNGDLVHTMAGKSVYVASTDAEGRLTLADAITYMIRKEKVDSIVELSTLTGTNAMFYSGVCCSMLTTSDELFNSVNAVSKVACEKYDRVPHFDEFREFIKHDIADLYNSSTKGAGCITAGLFLDEFSEDMPYMHVDVAGNTFNSAKKDGEPAGGNGFGVKTLYHYIKG